MTQPDAETPEWAVLAEFHTVEDALEIAADLLERDVRCLVQGVGAPQPQTAEAPFLALLLVPQEDVEYAHELMDGFGVDFEDGHDGGEGEDTPALADMPDGEMAAWVAVSESQNLSDADLVCSCLRAEGIPAWITDEHAYFADRGLPKCQIMVPVHRLEQAAGLIEEARAGALAIESEEEEA